MHWKPSTATLAPFVVALVSGCAAGAPPASGPEATARNEILMGPNAAFQRIGRLSAFGRIPFVGDVAMLAGPRDSTIVVLGVSFGSRALSFSRDNSTYAARYQIDIAFRGSGGNVISSRQLEVVRVGSFVETQRNDESIVFQQAFVMPPGAYSLAVSVKDPASQAESRAERNVEVKKFGDASFSTVAAVYAVEPRKDISDSFSGILSPRGTMPYGGDDTLKLYVEGYRLPGATELPVRVMDTRDSVLYRTSVRFDGGRPVEGHLITISEIAVPLGEVVIEVGAGVTAQRVKALTSLGSGWVISDFNAMLSLLRYFLVDPGKMSALRRAKPEERPAAWKRFWDETDPVPDTPENEAIERYFSRITVANERFSDETTEGWRTDRGEVYITLGEPDDIEQPPPLRGERTVRWGYRHFRVILEFVGSAGYPQLALTSESRAALARARNQAIQEAEARRATARR